MPLDEVARCLTQHGCTDISSDLDLPHCSRDAVVRGGFGVVYQGLLKSGQPIAIKCVDILGQCGVSDESHKMLKRAAKELYAWNRSAHPGVLTLFGFARFRGQIALISPWMSNGSLAPYLARKLDINYRIQLCIQITQALEHLHSSGVVHGDIKPDNVMLSDNYQALLADFGSAALAGDFSLGFAHTDPKFTIRFAAPELLYDASEHTSKTDIYALSMTMLNILTGKQPFPNKHNHANIIMEVAVKRNRPPISDFPMFAGRDRLWGLLERCWAHAPEDRPTASEILQTLIEIERGACELEPSASPCSQNILDHALSSRGWRDTLTILIGISILIISFLLSIRVVQHE